MYSFKIKALEEFVQIANNKYSTKNQILSNSSSIIENFSYVRNEYQTFYHILYDYIKDTLYTIGFETVFKLKGEKSNLLFEDLNTNTLRTVSFSITDPDSVVFLPQNVEITQALQNNFIQIYLYPNKLPKMPFAATCSLTNTSIISSFPPIDVIFQIARENLVSQDLNSFRQLFDLIPTLYVPVLLANYSVISENLANYSSLFTGQNEIIFGTDIFKMIINELNLASICSEFSNLNIIPNNFVTHSFPYYCRNFLTQEKLLAFDNSEFLTISPQDFKNDFSFVYSYLCLREFLSIFNTTQITPQIETSFKQISKYLLLIEPSIRSQVANDLFSLIFLQKDGQYICNAGIAQYLCHIIEPFTDLPLVRQAILSLNTGITGLTSANISAYFLAGKNALIKSVSNHDWKTANLIIKTSTLYKDFYDTALGVYQLGVHGLNQDSEISSNIIKLEYGFSSVNGSDALRMSRSRYPDYINLIDKRISISKKSNALYAFNNQFKYETIQNLASQLDDDPFIFLKNRKGEAFMDVFSLTKNLYEYLSYLNLYSRCLFSCTCIGITFGPLQSIRNAMLNGMIVDANNLANIYHLNLFDFVIENIVHFELTKEFVMQYYDEHPLVCTAIAATMFATQDFPMIPSKFLQKIEAKNDKIGNLTNLLLSKEKDLSLYDDYIYSISPVVLNSLIMKYINDADVDVILYIAEIIESLGENLDEKIIKLRLNKEIEKLSFMTDKTQIVQTLASENKKDALFAYLHRNETKKLIDVAMKNTTCLKRQIMEEFPIYIKYYIDELPDLSAKITREDRLFIKYFHSLPQRIINACENMDKRSIADFCVNDEEFCFNITVKSRILLSDLDYINIIKKQRPIDDFIAISRRILQFARDVIDFACIEVIEEYLIGLTIDSLEKEFEVQVSITKILHFLHDFKLSSPIFESFAEIINRSPYSIFNKPYSFKESNDQLQIIMFKLNLDSEYLKIENKIGYDSSQFITANVITLLKFGFFNEAKNYVQNYLKTHPGYDILESITSSIFIKDISPNIMDNISFCSPVIRYFIHSSFINHDVLKVVNITPPENLIEEKTFIGLSIYTHVHNISTQHPVKIPTKKNVRVDYIESCYQFLRAVLQIPSSIDVFIAFGDYADALTQLLSDSLDDKGAVIKSAIQSSIISNTFKPFLHDLKKMDSNMVLTRDIWNFLLEFCKQHELHLLLIEIYLSLDNRVEAAHEALEEFKRAEKASMQLFFLGSALNNLIEVKFSSEDGHSPLSANDEQILIIAEIQKELCIKVLENGMKKCPDLLYDPESIIEACALCVKFRVPMLYAKILALFQPKIFPIMVVEFLLKNDKSVTLSQIYDGINDIYGETGIRALLSAIQLTKDYSNIPELIVQRYGVDKNTKKAVKHLIEFDDLMTAFALCENSPDMNEFLPMIAHRASEIGLTHIVNIVSAKIRKGKN
ncbi:hypothetical protein TVAG_154420 [Trichomonas vaginalis G3]|uniref:Uncharacterized protein n=1 Tax=Trichomonas vaginalis (strain ATCC PRA-98 / G3) TaxID=412133 RepID=A2E448_TRIV3|nr:hypothetical protein TVAGG3_0703220 [Trichomonas vaginalis G3]EAY12591.1 hypothetical protein TVAG_154420 [Trichomonas vaginalis G3]KAI5509381.1 hypothetical protein TVAGG3_0703220 [Trichomonas vaginalis G3]|eukprot:XP_001324814.1 hypothetical protein [Trichomonas vaginalis G3]